MNKYLWSHRQLVDRRHFFKWKNYWFSLKISLVSVNDKHYYQHYKHLRLSSNDTTIFPFSKNEQNNLQLHSFYLSLIYSGPRLRPPATTITVNTQNVVLECVKCQYLFNRLYEYIKRSPNTIFHAPYTLVKFILFLWTLFYDKSISLTFGKGISPDPHFIRKFYGAKTFSFITNGKGWLWLVNMAGEQLPHFHLACDVMTDNEFWFFRQLKY